MAEEEEGDGHRCNVGDKVGDGNGDKGGGWQRGQGRQEQWRWQKHRVTVIHFNFIILTILFIMFISSQVIHSNSQGGTTAVQVGFLRVILPNATTADIAAV